MWGQMSWQVRKHKEQREAGLELVGFMGPPQSWLHAHPFLSLVRGMQMHLILPSSQEVCRRMCGGAHGALG